MRENTSVPGDDANCFLRLRNISKMFGGLHALENVDLDVRRGEVLGLLGDNGAGKTTLVKTISGV
jgi:ABC-type sugar transport system ATPase subunit